MNVGVMGAKINLPSFGRASVRPELSVDLHRARLAQTIERMRVDQIDVLLVYADREHCANLMYLTGFDPRFEEALLLLSADGRRKLLVGNECLGYLPEVKALDLEVELFQEAARRSAAREPFVLCTVTATSRSVPRDAGAKMLVAPDGSILCALNETRKPANPSSTAGTGWSSRTR